MAQTTKRALAASLKQLLEKMPLSKITVSDITEDCGVNRQTFYYHFKDVYDLIEWIYSSETALALKNKQTYATWQEGYLALFDYVLKNKKFVIHTYHSVSREFLEQHLHSMAYHLLLSVVEEVSQGTPIREDDKAFIADFYKYGFAGLLTDWIASGMKENPETIVGQLSVLMQGNIPGAIRRFSGGAPPQDPA